MKLKEIVSSYDEATKNLRSAIDAGSRDSLEKVIEMLRSRSNDGVENFVVEIHGMWMKILVHISGKDQWSEEDVQEIGSILRQMTEVRDLFEVIEVSSDPE